MVLDPHQRKYFSIMEWHVGVLEYFARSRRIFPRKMH